MQVIADVAAELSPISAQTGTPEFAHRCLLRGKPPINPVDFIADIASSSGELHLSATAPEGLGVPTSRHRALAYTVAEPRLRPGGSPMLDSRDRSAMVSMEKRGSPTPRSIWVVALACALLRHLRFRAPDSRPPSGRALSIMHHLRAKRLFECVSMSAASALSNKDSSWRHRLANKIQRNDLLYAPNAMKKYAIWTRSPSCLRHTVRVLMYSCGLSSDQDPEDSQ